LFGIKAASEKIAEEKQLQYKKHDEQLDKNNDPKLPANGHPAKAIVIEKENIAEHFYHYAYLLKILRKCFFGFITLSGFNLLLT
jgi:hypothetical protein